MLFVENEPNKDPRINLAIEEYLIKSVAPKEEILMFYINKPSIIVGRNQNTIQEINVDYVQEHDIIVVRRLSGGGGSGVEVGHGGSIGRCRGARSGSPSGSAVRSPWRTVGWLRRPPTNQGRSLVSVPGCHHGGASARQSYR